MRLVEPQKAVGEVDPEDKGQCCFLRRERDEQRMLDEVELGGMKRDQLIGVELILKPCELLACVFLCKVLRRVEEVPMVVDSLDCIAWERADERRLAFVGREWQGPCCWFLLGRRRMRAS